MAYVRSCLVLGAALSGTAALHASASIKSAPQADWRTGAPMLEARQELYPEVLNGKIYVAGGILNPNTRYSNAFDAYDPAEDRWTRLAPLPAARHHITLSAVNGLIYAIGGFSGGFPNWRAEKTMWV